MGISVDTLDRYYREEFETGKSSVDLAVAGKLVSAATAKEHTGPSIAAAIFYAKTQMGWKDRVILGGDQENPLLVKDVTPEARLDAFMAFLKRAGKA